MTCDRCILDGVRRPSDIALRQTITPTRQPVISLCSRHYGPLRQAYRDHGWVVVGLAP